MNACRGLYKSVLLFELAVIIPLLILRNGRPKERRRPHIVILLADDLGWPVVTNTKKTN